MREILFRGKRVDNEKWIEGRVFRLSEDFPPLIMLINRHGESHEIAAETVGQYTGLTDKNGKRIFEGDIVTADALFENRKVEFVDNTYWSAFCLVAANGDCDYMNEYGGIEVIGNIHDNPELLGGADNGE